MNTILFDLDGTLLPMDTHAFMKIYFGGLQAAMPQHDPDKLIQGVLAGMKAMVKNDGSCSNEKAFVPAFEAASGVDFASNEAAFLHYYHTDFDNVCAACNPTLRSKQLVEMLQDKGYTVAIATNPMFPQIATRRRLAWLGLELEQFPLVTTYEDSHFCKPNPAYYTEVLSRLGVAASDCIMVGNDVAEDGAAAQVGVPVMLVTDELLNPNNLPTDGFWAGTFEEFFAWAQALPTLAPAQS